MCVCVCVCVGGYGYYMDIKKMKGKLDGFVVGKERAKRRAPGCAAAFEWERKEEQEERG